MLEGERTEEMLKLYNNLDKERITTNIISKKETTLKIKKTLSLLSEVLSHTLGPYGTTTIIQDRTLEHFMTKDGYTVIKGIGMVEDVPRTVLDLVRRISRTLVKTVGDGSTSAIIISNWLYQKLDGLIEKYNIAPKDLVDALNVLSEELSWFIKSLSLPINENNMEILKTIAAIATNNDKETGELIYEIFQKVGRYGFINLENGKGTKDSYDITPGIELNRGMINYAMSNKPDKRTSELEDVYVFMCNDSLNERDIDLLSDIMGNCLKWNKGLVIVSKEFDSYVKAFFHANAMSQSRGGGSCNFVAVDVALNSVDNLNKFEDLATALNCTIYDKAGGDTTFNFKSLADLGYCKKTVIDDMRSKFINCVGNAEKISERVEFLKKELAEISKIEDHIDRDGDIALIKRRIASLSNSMATLYVGGNTESEKETRRYLIEDAVYACKSALEYGFVPGGNLIVPFILNSERNRSSISIAMMNKIPHAQKGFAFINELLDNVFEAFLYSYKTVLRNAALPKKEIDSIIKKCLKDKMVYNLKEHTFESYKTTKVLNSAETDIEIVKACFSIIGLLVTSNQFLSLNVK
jgi:chaperonin GroEL